MGKRMSQKPDGQGWQTGRPLFLSSKTDAYLNCRSQAGSRIVRKPGPVYAETHMRLLVPERRVPLLGP